MRTSFPPVTVFCGAIILLGFAITCDLVAQPYVVAQSDYVGQNGNTGGRTSGYPWAQTFTATRRGTLFSLGAGFYMPYVPADSYYIFQFRDTTPAGLPASQVMASVNVPTSLLNVVPPLPGGYGWVDLTADFSRFEISLVAGHAYTLSIDTPGPVGQSTFNDFFWGTTRTPYAGGHSYVIPPTGTPTLVSHDFLFTVKAVPEPSALALAAVALGALTVRTSRRRLSNG